MSIIEEYRQQVEQHRMYKRITMLEGNSVSDEISEAVKNTSAENSG